MKYFALILLFALQAHAEDLVCDLKGKEFVTIFGLSQTPQTHKVTLRFKDAHPTDIVATVTTIKTTEFFDWGGTSIEMHRQIGTSVLPYPTFHFTLEIQQKVGGHCADLGCIQDATFYQDDQADHLECSSKGFSSKPADPALPSEQDYCIAECGRTCLEKPIFCGGW